MVCGEWKMSFETFVSLLKDELGLELEPVALRRVEAPPRGVSIFMEDVPSACTFWRRAEKEIFYADAKAHLGCPIGAMVMGFDLPKEKGDELAGLVKEMLSIFYIQEEEVANIPKFEGGHRGIVYGPLAIFPFEPELLLLWLTPAQAMILQEATGEITWSLGTEAGLFGRPACAVLPKSLERNRPALSLGCTGMRTFTEIAENRMLLAIPAVILPPLEQKLQKAVSANRRMKALYLQKKQAKYGILDSEER